ncbi:hypothetical protein ACFVYT_24790 [Streptomyces sp. NPDC058290]|uniref:hypothetical protein n=1 Tax=Streptomyces sp. NPDC058290 TaxID=3346426 RepID=UPI0036DFCA12
MTVHPPATDFRTAADALRDLIPEGAFEAEAVPLQASVVHAFANWLDDAASDSEEIGAADPVALIAALKVLATRPEHSCGNCDGVTPENCVFNLNADGSPR